MLTRTTDKAETPDGHPLWPRFVLATSAAAVVLYFLPSLAFHVIAFLPALSPLWDYENIFTWAHAWYGLVAIVLTIVALRAGCWRDDPAIRFFIAAFFMCELLIFAFAGAWNVFSSDFSGYYTGYVAVLFFLKLFGVLLIAAVNVCAIATGVSWSKWTMLAHAIGYAALTILRPGPEPNGPEWIQLMEEVEQSKAGGIMVGEDEVYFVEVEVIQSYPDWFTALMYVVSLAYFFVFREQWKRAAAPD